MRRTLMLLAVLLAGLGGTGAPTAQLPAAAAHALSTAEDATAAALLRSAGTPLTAAWQEGSGPDPRPLSRRPHVAPRAGALVAALTSRSEPFRARAATHRAHTTPLALTLAGRFSSSPSTPPPFRSV